MKFRPKTFLKETFYTLNGWRFRDLKDFIREHQSQPSASSSSLMLWIDSAVGSRQVSGVKDAIISAMPPSQTGVATCNHKTLLEGRHDADIISKWESLESYALTNSGMSGAGQCFDHSFLPVLAVRRKYHNLVVSVGNSNHDLFAVLTMMRFPYYTVCKNLTLHLHDGCLLNLAQKSAAMQGKTLMDEILRSYTHVNNNDLRSLADSSIENWHLFEELVTRGIYGLRLIIDYVKPTRIVVNSNYAAEMLHKDFGPAGCPLPIDLGFHPVFQSDNRTVSYKPWTPDQDLRVGSFGIPSESKLTSLIIRACRVLHNSGTKVRLVLAGFHCDEYIKRVEDIIQGLPVEIYSDVTDAKLLSVMDTVHVAVQLRRRNLGESSGVVASLIQKEVPTIVSSEGAFSDYKECCVMVPTDVSPQDLAQAILDTARTERYETMRNRMTAYASTHAPDSLCRTLFV